MKINKKELAVGNTAYVVTKKYDSDQMKQVYHIDPDMHLGHLKEKAGYMITFLEKQKIQKIV